MKREIDFQQSLPAHWHIINYGNGRVNQQPNALQLTLPATHATRYHDAQLTDYVGKGDFRWRPPLRMEVVASASLHPLVGTAGFGFWNHPFVPSERGVRLPKAVWFFFSAPPSNMQLAQGVTGPGWKAATIDATRWQFLALAPTAPVSILLMRFPTLYRRLWPIGQRAIGVSEHLLESSLLLERHTYSLDWQVDHVRFAVDDVTVHEARVGIKGALGFIAWMDNQYAVVTPQGQIKFGLVDVPQPQTLMIERVEIKMG
ncbi:MAG: hypothetical protein H0X30_29360 [Anaerolineae bacterium]|nr:hypothetical protein [Anaerolineae bacterium]